MKSSSKISLGLNANPMLFLIAWLLLIAKPMTPRWKIHLAASKRKALSVGNFVPRLVPVSQVLKADCSQLKSCRQKLLLCSTIYDLGLLDLSALGTGAPALQAMELWFGVGSLLRLGTG